MCLYPEITKIIQYINGSSIYISGIEPFSFQTREIENHEIHAIISLMEEINMPDFLRQSIDKKTYPWIYHHYYNIKDTNDEKIELFFESLGRKITSLLDRKMNILIHCRTGISLSITILLAFFIRASVFTPQYLIYDYFHFIPKTRIRWCDSLLDFIKYYHPDACPRTSFMNKLYIYENNLLIDNEMI